MPLVAMKEILTEAREKRYGVGAFEFWSVDSAQAVVETAQEMSLPVILQAGLIESEFAGGIKNIFRIARIVADAASIKVALHLDHAESYEFICSAIDAGFTSVMIDASNLPITENMRLTKKVVLAAKSYGVTVEAELGRLAGNEGNTSASEEEAAQTDPEEARRFVDETDIDALAVAIGTAHGFYKHTPRINIERLKKITELVGIPLVLHGGSGVPDDKIKEAIENGITKINICTEFVAAFGKEYIQTQNNAGFKYSVPTLFGPSKEAGKKLVKAKLELFANKT